MNERKNKLMVNLGASSGGGSGGGGSSGGTKLYQHTISCSLPSYGNNYVGFQLINSVSEPFTVSSLEQYFSEGHDIYAHFDRPYKKPNATGEYFLYFSKYHSGGNAWNYIYGIKIEIDPDTNEVLISNLSKASLGNLANLADKVTEL